MGANVKSKIGQGAKGAAPWRKGIPWGLVMAEGILLLALGIYMYVAHTQSRLVLGAIIAIALAVTGAVQLYAALRSKEKGTLANWFIARGAIGLGAGGLVLLLVLFNAGSINLWRIILGLGSLAYGAIGIYILYLTHETGLRLMAIVNSLFFVFIGVVMLADYFGAGVFVAVTNVLNILLLLVGAFLILWSLVLRNNNQDAAVA